MTAAVAPSGAATTSDELRRRRLGSSPSSVVWDLLLCQTAALTVQLVAVSLAWDGDAGTANILSCTGIALTFGSALWALTRADLDRTLRTAAVVCLGVTTTIQWRMVDPLLFRGYDEQLHMRTLGDIEASHQLFQPHPLLAVSPRYPGLESVAALLHQFGLPPMAAATGVVLLARLALVLTLCAAVEHLTGSARAGGLAVAMYAISPQFVFFNSQFAYQTLSLPLALAAVAFVVRARDAAAPAPLLGGATVCLLAVALTHHLTSLLTAGFLVLWTLVEPPGRARRRVAAGALVAVLATAAWAAIQWSLLRDYFGPMIDDVTAQLTTGVQRRPFAETAAAPKPLWEQLLLVYYAAAVTMTVAGLLTLRSPALRERFGPWRPRMLLVVLVAAIPVLFAARVLPRWGEVGDRASTFLYLPFSLLVVSAALHLRRRGLCARRLLRPAVLCLGAAAFLGGYLLGTGSEWARLPGGYLPGADSRSMDAQTLTAVRWAGEHLEPGSRIGADRINSTLLASQARLWPVFSHDDSPEVAVLYRSERWGEQETDIVRRKHLSYLFVDRRVAGRAPLVGTYFDESPAYTFSAAALAKFDTVPGMREIYRHGAMSVYDLRGLGVTPVRSGWYGQATPTTLASQVAAGFLAGLSLTVAAGFAAGRAVLGFVRSIYLSAGAQLAVPFVLASLCIGSVLLILTRLWLGPWMFVTATAVVVLAHPGRTLRTLGAVVPRLWGGWAVAVGSLTVAIAVVLGLCSMHAAAAHRLDRTSGALPCEPAPPPNHTTRPQEGC